MQGELKPGGALGLRVPGRDPWEADIMDIETIERHGQPQPGLPDPVNRWRMKNWRHLSNGIEDWQHARKCRFPVLVGSLYLRKITPDRVLTFGLASVEVVTDEFVQEIVDRLHGAGNAIGDFKYHGIGTNNGGTNEAAGDSALDSELTTEYATDNTRATDSQGEGSSANIYQTVGTNEVDASVGIKEHGVFNVQTPGGAGELLMDRSTFSVINLSAGEKIQSTYELTIPSGS